MPSDVVTGDLAALASETLKSGQGDEPRASGRHEIVMRVASAIVLVPLGLYVVYAGGWVLILATGLCAMLAEQSGRVWRRPRSRPGPSRLLTS